MNKNKSAIKNSFFQINVFNITTAISKITNKKLQLICQINKKPRKFYFKFYLLVINGYKLK